MAGLFDTFKKRGSEELDRARSRKFTDEEETKEITDPLKVMFGAMGTLGLGVPSARPPKGTFKFNSAAQKEAAERSAFKGGKFSDMLKSVTKGIDPEQVKVISDLAKRIPEWIRKPNAQVKLIGMGLGGAWLINDALDFFIDDTKNKDSDKTKVRVFRDEYTEAVGDNRVEAEDRLDEINKESIESLELQKEKIFKAMGEF